MRVSRSPAMVNVAVVTVVTVVYVGSCGLFGDGSGRLDRAGCSLVANQSE